MAETLIEKARQLPADLKALFFGDEPMLAGEEAALLYGIPEEKISAVTLPLGTIIVGDMKLGEYPADIAAKAGVDEATASGIAYEVNKRIFLKFPGQFKDAEGLQRDWEMKKKPPVMSEGEAKKKLLELEPWLLEKNEEAISQEKEIAASQEKLPLLAALGKYRGLSEQVITQEKIRIKGQPEPVRPTLVNWLRAYRDELGIGYHDPVLRAKFLFNSQNVKKLSSDERERLNLILRSVEDNVPVDIDTRKMEIVFPSFSIGQREQKERKEPSPSFSKPPLLQPQAPQPKPLSTSPEKPKSLLETFRSAPVPPPTPRAMEPPLAPKRKDTQASSTVPAPQSISAFPQPKSSEVTPEQEAGFRVGKGMHFMSLEQKAVPPKPEQSHDAVSAPPLAPPAKAFSFSSKHTFQAEHGNGEKFSINKAAGTALPSGVSFTEPSKSASPQLPPTAAPSPEKSMNPFQIRPVSLHGKSGEEDMGRIVDLRNN